MAKVKETNFQSRLLDQMKKDGTRAKKMQSGMGYTVLDVYVRHPNFGSQWWELKTILTSKTKVPLTTLQRLEIRDETLAGGSAACVVAIKQGYVEQIYVIGMEDTHVRPEQLVQSRERGTKYDINRIANAVAIESERLRLRVSKGEFQIGTLLDKPIPKGKDHAWRQQVDGIARPSNRDGAV